jgi:hypothetical protein
LTDLPALFAGVCHSALDAESISSQISNFKFEILFSPFARFSLSHFSHLLTCLPRRSQRRSRVLFPRLPPCFAHCPVNVCVRSLALEALLFGLRLQFTLQCLWHFDLHFLPLFTLLWLPLRAPSGLIRFRISRGSTVSLSVPSNTISVVL